MSNNKGIFPDMLKNPKIFRELLKRVTGRDPGDLEHLLLCGKSEETYDDNLRLETSIYVDYNVFEDDSHKLHTFSIFYEPMCQNEGYFEFLDRIATGYMEARYGDCSPLLKRTAVSLMRFPNAPEHSGENEFLIDMCERPEDPAIAEILILLYMDECEPVTKLGKATKEYLINIWGENYWE